MPKRHTLYVTLPRVLDSAGFARLPPLIPASGARSHEVLLDAASLEEICPIGVARLWDACRRAIGTHGADIRLLSLPPGVARRLRHHPLRDLAIEEDLLFAEPYGARSASRR